MLSGLVLKQCQCPLKALFPVQIYLPGKSKTKTLKFVTYQLCKKNPLETLLKVCVCVRAHVKSWIYVTPAENTDSLNSSLGASKLQSPCYMLKGCIREKTGGCKGRRHFQRGWVLPTFQDWVCPLPCCYAMLRGWIKTLVHRPTAPMYITSVSSA